MPKNKSGGNKAKKQGNKFVNNGGPTREPARLRLVTEEGEMYGCVTKLFGGAVCEVMCLDGTKRKCMIRNKFRGRFRRQNNISAGAWVLVGERDWQTTKTGETPICDLLEVFSYNEIERMKLTVNENWSVFNGIGQAVKPSEGEEDQDSAFVFDSRDHRKGGGGGGIAEQEDFLAEAFARQAKLDKLNENQEDDDDEDQDQDQKDPKEKEDQDKKTTTKHVSSTGKSGNNHNRQEASTAKNRFINTDMGIIDIDSI